MSSFMCDLGNPCQEFFMLTFPLLWKSTLAAVRSRSPSKLSVGVKFSPTAQNFTARWWAPKNKIKDFLGKNLTVAKMILQTRLSIFINCETLNFILTFCHQSFAMLTFLPAAFAKICLQANRNQHEKQCWNPNTLARHYLYFFTPHFNIGPEKGLPASNTHVAHH